MNMLATLPDRGVVEISGDDRVSFLQGLVSNDVAEATPDRAVWAALLTPQGKWLADFFVIASGDVLLLDCARDQAAWLARTLGRYKLRAKVALRDLSDQRAVHAAWGERPEIADALAVADPRHPLAGWRAISPSPLAETATAEDWHRHRIALGLPDGARDMEAEKSVLLEAGFDELHGVSWSKGCYLGQELTARTKYRGLIKRRLTPVRVEGVLPPPGTPVMRGEEEVGTLRFGVPGLAMALLRIEALDADALRCDGAQLVPRKPDWMR
jgi:tRNA-modifying protein YgfZ